MKLKKDGCVCCGIPPCLNCKDTYVLVCDVCEEEVEELRYYDGIQICEFCFMNQWKDLDTVE